MPAAGVDDFEDEGTLVLEQRFAIVPEWVLDADISDAALRLYAVLLRYGQSSGQRMPSRALLASRLHKTSTDTVDRALKDLVRIGAVRIERRKHGQQSLTNRYHLRSSPPDQQRPRQRGGRKFAAIPGRTDAATPAAEMRPNPEPSTQTTPPPAPPSRAPNRRGGGTAVAGPGLPTHDDGELVAVCGIRDLGDLAADCARRRKGAGRSTAGWTAPRLLEALREAVVGGNRPPEVAVAALLDLAADSATHSPRRLAAPGPWWATGGVLRGATTEGARPQVAVELEALEARLTEADGRRLWVQRRAREELTRQGRALTRLSVARRACELLDEADTGSG